VPWSNRTLASKRGRDIGAQRRFIDDLNDAERGLLDYWLGKRQDGLVPQRATIDPVEIRQWLPWLQLHWREPAGRYLCRLSGTGIVQAAGVDSTGRYFDEIVAPSAYSSRQAMFDRTLATGLPAHYRTRITVAGVEWKIYRRMLLPLRYRAAVPDMVLSLVAFEATPPDAEAVDANSLLEACEAAADEMA